MGNKIFYSIKCGIFGEISGLVEDKSFLQEGHCSMELVCYLVS